MLEVVQASLVGIAQNAVGKRELLHAGEGALTGHVGMVAACEAAEREADGFGVGVGRHAQQRIVVQIVAHLAPCRSLASRSTAVCHTTQECARWEAAKGAAHASAVTSG